MANYEGKRIAGTIKHDASFRLRALVYTLHSEGFTLSGIHDLLSGEYQLEEIDIAYRKRNQLPRCMVPGGE